MPMTIAKPSAKSRRKSFEAPNSVWHTRILVPIPNLSAFTKLFQRRKQWLAPMMAALATFAFFLWLKGERGTLTTYKTSSVCRENENSSSSPTCEISNEVDSDLDISGGDAVLKQNSRVPDGCTLVMSNSGIPNSGWGVFTLTDRRKGELVLDQGDIIIQLPDPIPHKTHEMRRLLWEYVWNGEETGGHYEGLRAMSVVPGMGMLVNGHSKSHNIAPQFPSVDDGGLRRGVSHGAGAISHYHNFTWFVEHNLSAGEELFVDFGPGWFKERGFGSEENFVQKKDVSHLWNTGYCLDNIVPANSLLDGAGRGAFASRDLKEGSIIAPVPVIALSSSSLEMMKEREDGSIEKSTQLLKNYCFGHRDSSMLLYPYSHGINLVNHHPTAPNAKLRWWKGSEPFFDKNLLELQSKDVTLLLELVATRQIRKGEEILLDYGKQWDEAWKRHLASWKPGVLTNQHLTSESMNNGDEFSVIRTEDEQQSNPYPPDVFTSCFYSFSGKSQTSTHAQKSVARWESSEVEVVMRNLRPCQVVKRDVTDDLTYIYTVRIMNRPGLHESVRIPKGHFHFVTHVPRDAIQFSDKVYTSDQHLNNSFRKEIGLGESFPMKWRDLLEQK